MFVRQDNTFVVKWQGMREVTVLTTNYEAGMVEKSKTYFGGGTVFYNNPQPIDKYNEKNGQC